jgi:triphosphoribosyl-dephospho-CoA synthase
VTLADAASAHIRDRTDPDLRRQLGRIGRQAETAMLDATGGVHTHPGAIFSIGFLAAARRARADGHGTRGRAGRRRNGERARR